MSKASDREFTDIAKSAIGMAEAKLRSGTANTDNLDFQLVKMMAVLVKNGDLRGPVFLRHPDHLPEGQDLRVLMIGKAEKDNELRADARDWAARNREEAVRASAGLRNAITAIRLADELLNDPSNDEVLHEWKTEIAAYCKDTFSCDTREAPFAKLDLDAWCLKVCQLRNPVPAWLENWRADQKMQLEPATTDNRNLRYAEDE